MADRFDCVIIGGGPAGLTAAIYLARFRLGVLVLDGGDSRAALIPCTRNHAGFPDGVTGEALLQRMAAQADRFGAERIFGKAQRLTPGNAGFTVHSDARSWEASAVLLATGVFNRRPKMEPRLHDEAVARGYLRYCPVCDGYEVTDRRVAVVGMGARGAREAIFLRSYTQDVSLVSPEPQDQLDADDRRRLGEAGVRVLRGPAADYGLEPDGLSFACGEGRLTFASVYPAMGSIVRSDLASDLGAKVSADGCVLVDAHQRTSVQRLYAAGDVVIGLDQISHAMGQAGVAATAIRNDLAACRPQLR
jgi:thioredoxin reductase (NADPH)